MDTTEIEARLAAATPGDWEAFTDVSEVWKGAEWLISSTMDDGAVYLITDWGSGLRGPDAEFIAHAPEDIRALLDEVKRLQAQIDAVVHIHKYTYLAGIGEYCGACDAAYPCPTLLAFHGDES